MRMIFHNAWRMQTRFWSYGIFNVFGGPDHFGFSILNFCFEFRSRRAEERAKAIADALAYTDQSSLKNIENTMFSSNGVSE